MSEIEVPAIAAEVRIDMPDEHKSTNTLQNIIKLTTMCCVSIVVIPIIIADLYYLLNSDWSCMEAGTLSMKVYLAVSVSVNLASLAGFIMAIKQLNLSNAQKEEDSVICFYCYMFISKVVAKFYLIWNIIGMVGLWTEMNKQSCPDLFMYLFVSILIKLIFGVIGECQPHKSDD
jgi:hypothetical protein